MRFTVALLVIAIAAFDSAAGQETKGAQSKYEPRSEPGAGQALLKKFEGDWHVIKVLRGRTGNPIRVQGRCRQTMIHDGRFLQSEFTFEQGGATTTGLGIIGFEPESGKFTSFWTDSRQTRMSIRESRDRFDGERIILYPEKTEARRSKTVSHLEDDGRKLIHRQYALEPDGRERLFMELIMTRTAAAKSNSG
jgi:Protein of unknown function (DUF1579)